MDSQYVRLTNSVTDFGRLIPLSDFTDANKLQSYLKESPNTDWYSSLFSFGEDAKQYFEKNSNSIKGYNGKAITNTLVFDFDSKVDLNIAKDDAIALLMQLREQGVDVNKSVRVFFSGSKGFHVELYTKKFFTPDECKELSLWIKKIFKLPTLDTVIYNTTRLYRINNTINPKSKLYKIELEPQDLTELSIDQIKAKATSPILSDFTPVPAENLKFIDAYKVLYMQKPVSVVVESTEEIDGIRGIDTIDFNECPRTTPRCMFALSKGIMKPGMGERNVLFLRLAAFYKNQGFTSKETLLPLLVGISELNAKLYPDAEPYTKAELENTVVNSVLGSKTFKQMPGASGVSPENELIKKYCEAVGDKTTRKCCLHSRAESRETTVQIESVSDSFEQFASNFDKNTVKTGIEFIDDNMNIAVGTTTLLVGATGSGKTTAALNVMENANAAGLHTVFFSLDMHKNLIYLKLAQKLTNFTQQQILDFYKYKNYDKITFIKKAIADKYGKTFFDFSSTLSMDQMRDKIFNIEDEKVKIKLVVVDYASRITGQFADRYANATYNALKSTEVASVTDAAWIYISQISRNSGDGCAPLRTKRAAKESGDWEESATNVVTVWRPFMGDPDRDYYIRMFLAKNRMGREVETVLRFEGAKGLIRDMDIDEHSEYSATLEKEERDYLKSKFNKI